ncbi:hypothetical protein PUN28_007158 [Cardiocondyla obscurior]|uniref:Uncharacterized protein n=1 Tax=Cardiocondyla obscurior TaxID=286306 RepID=A0AAW2G3I3_9HYME
MPRIDIKSVYSRYVSSYMYTYIRSLLCIWIITCVVHALYHRMFRNLSIIFISRHCFSISITCRSTVFKYIPFLVKSYDNSS